MRKFQVTQGSATPQQLEAIAIALAEHEKPAAAVVRSNYGKPVLRKPLTPRATNLRSS
jgi:hypothetical protein